MRTLTAVVAAVLLALAARAATNAVSMTTNITSGASTVTAAWAALATPPDKVLVTIQSPAQSGTGSLRIFATPVVSTLTTSNVTLHLSGVTDSTGYVAHVSVWE